MISLQVITRARKFGRTEFSTNQALTSMKKINLWDWNLFHAKQTNHLGLDGVEASEVFATETILTPDDLNSVAFAGSLMKPFSTQESVRHQWLVCNLNRKCRV
jgi:hypothetical protein